MDKGGSCTALLTDFKLLTALDMISLYLNYRHTVSPTRPLNLCIVNSDRKHRTKVNNFIVILLIYLQVSHKVQIQTLFSLTFISAIFSSLKKKMLRATQSIRFILTIPYCYTKLFQTQNMDHKLKILSVILPIS